MFLLFLLILINKTYCLEYGNNFIVKSRYSIHIREGEKASIRFRAQNSGQVMRIFICCKVNGTSTYKIRLEKNNENNLPSGELVSPSAETTFIATASGWQGINFTEAPQIEKNNIYHIVILPYNTNEQNYIELYRTSPFNEAWINGITTNQERAILYFDGERWTTYKSEPLYILKMQNKCEGNPYHIAAEKIIYSTKWCGEEFVLLEDKQVVAVKFYIKAKDKPQDDLYLVLEEKKNKNIIYSATLLNKAFATTTYNFIKHQFSTPITLKSNTFYRIYLKSPNSNLNAYYCINTPSTEKDIFYTSLTYDGTSSVLIYSEDSGENWKEEEHRDIVYLFSILELSGWQIRVLASLPDYNIQDEAYIGLSEVATDSFTDDIEEPPSTPDENYLSLYFKWQDKRYNTDIRQLKNLSQAFEVWQLYIETGLSNPKINFSYKELSNLDYWYKIILFHNENIINLREVGTYSYNYAEGATLTLFIGGRIEYSKELNPGWNMFAIPVEVTNSVEEILSDDLEKIKLFSYRNGGYVMYNKYHPTLFGTLSLGEGYWLMIDGGTLSVIDVSGNLATQITENKLPLNKGWNLIGSPCGFVIDNLKENIKVKYQDQIKSIKEAIEENWLGSYFFHYEAGGYKLCQEDILPWRGYFIKANKENLELIFPSLYSSINKAYLKPQAIDDMLFKLRIMARADDKHDLDNYIGLIDEANDNKNNNIEEPPPPPSSYIRLYFLEQDTKLSQSIKSFKNREEWLFNVESDIPDVSVILSWEIINIFPDAQLQLIDEDMGVVINMNNLGKYEYCQGGIKRSFRIIFSTDALPSGEIFAYPNPVRRYPYVINFNNLKQGMQVYFYNLSGELIKITDYTKPWIDVEKLQSGIYFYLIKDANNKVIKKDKIIVIK